MGGIVGENLFAAGGKSPFPLIFENGFDVVIVVGFRIGAELISGVIVGAGIGYLLDILFGTRPLLLIIFLFLGGVAGFLNVYRFVKSMEKEQE